MAKKTAVQTIEREYIIPLKREIMKVPRYKRTPKAVKAVKQFIAKHMHVIERDVKKVKIDKYLNQQLWFRGIQNPPTKIKVKAVKQGDIVRVELVDIPEKVKFQMAREDKTKKESEKTKKEKKEEVEKPKEETSEEKKEEQEDKKEERKEEVEKEKAVKDAGEKTFEAQAKQMKHTQIDKVKKTQPRRMALQK